MMIYIPRSLFRLRLMFRVTIYVSCGLRNVNGGKQLVGCVLQEVDVDCGLRTADCGMQFAEYGCGMFILVHTTQERFMCKST